MSTILGIDPGTTTTGYAIISGNRKKFIIQDYGVIHTTPKLSLEYKLEYIYKDIKEIIETHKPDSLFIEKLFFVQNVTNGIQVAHARGIILLEAQKKWIPIYELSPLEVKKWISGSGRASKIQVQKALVSILGLSQIPKPDDAADALALAFLGLR